MTQRMCVNTTTPATKGREKDKKKPVEKIKIATIAKMKQKVMVFLIAGTCLLLMGFVPK